MCGIVGIYYKNKDLNKHLGTMLSSMLVQMSERGPDSAGVAVYRNAVDSSSTKITLHAADDDYDWNQMHSLLAKAFSTDVDIEIRVSHAVVATTAPLPEFRTWLALNCPAAPLFPCRSLLWFRRS